MQTFSDYLGRREKIVAESVTPHQLAEAIRSVVEEWGVSPQEINAGRCEDFAYAVLELLGDPPEVEHEIFPGRPSGTHSYLTLGGRYFDAEAPMGVNAVRDLPVIKRWLAGR